MWSGMCQNFQNEMSDFTMGTILGKGFAQALVHTIKSTRAFGTRAIDNMHLCLSKTLSQNCPHDEIRQTRNLIIVFTSVGKEIRVAWLSVLMKFEAPRVTNYHVILGMQSTKTLASKIFKRAFIQLYVISKL